METFDTDKFRSELDLLSKRIMPGCGLVFELYQRRLSAAIDEFIARLPKEQHAQAFELARQEFDYLSAEEIADEIRRDAEKAIVATALIAIAALLVAVI